jgi:outer membrane protein assembly factor BamA
VEASTRVRQVDDEPAVERLEFAPRGFFEVGRRNLWGKNRSIDLFTRLSLRPRNTADPSYGLNEYRGVLSYREPRAFGWNADAFVTGVLERAIRSSFSYDRRALQAQLVRRLRPRLSVSGHYSFERTKLFDEQIAPEDELIVDRLYPRVRLSSFSTAILRDTRDDPLDPAEGTLLGLDSELAARIIGSQVGFAKVFGQAFWFRRLPGARRIVFASGARVGLGRGFSQDVQRLGPIVGPTGAAVDTIEEIPASERFFAGGDNTVRGFALDRLGDEATLDANGVPTGGNAVFVFNGELRVHVWRDFGAVGFLDVGNVFARVSDIDFGSLRGAVGFGVRYQSPFGPLRFDVGFKLDQQTFANGSRERLTAYHISIGHAF